MTSSSLLSKEKKPSSTTYGKEMMDEIAKDGELTALQKHVAFFDRNKDGVVYPWESFQGFRALGYNLPISLSCSFLVNSSLSPYTTPGCFPNLLFPIYVKNVHKSIHGSDTGVYDKDGRFVQEKFEEMFDKHAHTNRDGLTIKELREMRKANRTPRDYIGRLQSYFEWDIFMYSRFKDENGLLPKRTIRAAFDGSLFEDIEREGASGSS